MMQTSANYVFIICIFAVSNLFRTAGFAMLVRTDSRWECITYQPTHQLGGLGAWEDTTTSQKLQVTPGVSRKGGRVLYNISLTNQPGSWNLEKMHAKTSSDPRCFKKRWVGSLPGSAIMDWCHWKADKLGYLRRKFYVHTAIYRSGNIYIYVYS